MHTNETKIYTALLIAAFVLALILTFFILSLVRQHRRNVQLHREKLHAEITTLENERKRIVADLHDEIGPLLSSAKLLLSSLDNNDAADTRLVNTSLRYLDDTINKLREISINLMPTVLLRKGLATAIKEFAEVINMAGKIKIVCQFNIEREAINSETELHLYRVLKEIIHNSLKHAQASLIQINAHQTATQLHFTVTDNGKGFLYNALKDKMGLGLRNIASRIEILNGSLYFNSEPGKGVVYTFEIPIT